MNSMKAAKSGTVIDLTPYLPQAEESGLDYFTASACRRRPKPSRPDPKRFIGLAADLLEIGLTLITGAVLFTFLLVLLTVA